MATQKIFSGLTGSQIVFSTNFGVYSTGAVRVYLDLTGGGTYVEQTLTTEYTVDGIEDGSTTVDVTVPGASLCEGAGKVKIVLDDNVSQTAPEDHEIVGFGATVNPSSAELQNQILLLLQQIGYITGGADLSETDIAQIDSRITTEILLLQNQIAAGVPGLPVLDTAPNDADKHITVNAGGTAYELTSFATDVATELSQAVGLSQMTDAMRLTLLNASLKVTPMLSLQGSDGSSIPTITAATATTASLASLGDTTDDINVQTAQAVGAWGIRMLSTGGGNEIPVGSGAGDPHCYCIAEISWDQSLMSAAGNQLNLSTRVQTDATGATSTEAEAIAWAQSATLVAADLMKVNLGGTPKSTEAGDLALVNGTLTIAADLLKDSASTPLPVPRIFIGARGQKNGGTDLQLAIGNLRKVWFT